MNASHPRHKLGKRARILLSSVFGPYAQDDSYGSRKINPMELYQNQVTRVQGVFSLRMFHRSFGLLMIQENIDAPCTLLDFPSRERFMQEIQTQTYDVIGISAIYSNSGKVQDMCRLIRRYQPSATIIIGGHIANYRDLPKTIDADHIVRGDGIRWFREYLGQDPETPVRHPAILSGFSTRILGIPIPERQGSTAAIFIPSVGCPMGCNFCSTSAMFGGKGKFINFFETGEEIFNAMCEIEEKLQVNSFFILDENFLFHRKRALDLLELIKANDKSWSFYVFSSARVIQSYSVEQLVDLGIVWVWMGIEGEDSQYRKLNQVDPKALVRNLQSHGICVLGSSIIGLENHTPDNIDRVIDHAVSFDTDFHQFMLYTPIPGTPLHEEHQRRGTLLSESGFSPADSHGQYRFNYRHAHITEGQEEKYLLSAFERDFKVNGPSLARMIRTILQGWKKYHRHPDKRVFRRIDQWRLPLQTSYAGAVWAMKKWYRNDPGTAAKMDDILNDIYDQFGWKARISAEAFGRIFYVTCKREEKRLAAGWTLEPACYYEKNTSAKAISEALPEDTPLPAWKRIFNIPGLNRIPVHYFR